MREVGGGKRKHDDEEKEGGEVAARVTYRKLDISHGMKQFILLKRSRTGRTEYISQARCHLLDGVGNGMEMGSSDIAIICDSQHEFEAVIL